MRPIASSASASGSTSICSTSYASCVPHVAVRLPARLSPGLSWSRRVVLRSTDDSKQAQTTSDSSASGSSAPPAATATPPSPAAPASPSTSSSADPDDAAVVAELEGMWEKFKKGARKEMTEEQAQVMDTIKVEDLMGDSNDMMRKLADEQLGPLLQSVGVTEEPLSFFLDLLRLALGTQLVSAAALFYGTELLGGYDSGEAFRCVAGLAAGYLSRPFYRLDLLLAPLYDSMLRIVAPGTVYEVATSADESATALSRLGVTVAVCSFLPQLLWGWDTEQCLQFVLPLSAGWVLFDCTFMAAMLYKLQPWR